MVWSTPVSYVLVFLEDYVLLCSALTGDIRMVSRDAKNKRWIFFWSTRQRFSEVLTLLPPQAMLVLFKGNEESCIFSFQQDRSEVVHFWLFSQLASFIPSVEAWLVLLSCWSLIPRYNLKTLEHNRSYSAAGEYGKPAHTCCGFVSQIHQALLWKIIESQNS